MTSCLDQGGSGEMVRNLVRIHFKCRTNRICSVGFVRRLGVRCERKRGQRKLEDFLVWAVSEIEFVFTERLLWPALGVSWVTVFPIQNLNLRCLREPLGSLIKVIIHSFIQPIIPHTKVCITKKKMSKTQFLSCERSHSCEAENLTITIWYTKCLDKGTR